MRKDEGFVIESIGTAYSGDWKPGANPPDAYVRIVVLSWTCLMQSLRPFCPRGPTQSLLLTATGFIGFWNPGAVRLFLFARRGHVSLARSHYS
jgi:hypothetical protein